MKTKKKTFCYCSLSSLIDAGNVKVTVAAALFADRSASLPLRSSPTALRRCSALRRPRALLPLRSSPSSVRRCRCALRRPRCAVDDALIAVRGAPLPLRSSPSSVRRCRCALRRPRCAVAAALFADRGAPLTLRSPSAVRRCRCAFRRALRRPS